VLDDIRNRIKSMSPELSGRLAFDGAEPEPEPVGAGAGARNGRANGVPADDAF